MHIEDKILCVETAKLLPVLKRLALRHALAIFSQFSYWVITMWIRSRQIPLQRNSHSIILEHFSSKFYPLILYNMLMNIV
jgi:hypothetical protein